MNTTNTQCDKTNFELIDSGVSWIGKIPEHWNIVKIGGIYQERNQQASAKKYQPLSVTKMGILPQLEDVAKTNDLDNRKLVLINDFVINSRSDRRNSCGISQYDGSVSLINTVLEPIFSNDKINNKYFDYIFHTVEFADEFYRWGHGIVDDLWTTRWREMKKIKLPFPPLSEQIKIADYLDHQCGLTDDIILNLTNKIDALDQYKKSLIKEKVTTGFNNDDLIDSTIPWIGKIPSHWIKAKVKDIFTIKNSKARQIDPVVLTLARSGVKVRDISTNEGQLAQSYFNYNPVSPGDLLLNPMDLISGANCSISYVEGVISPAYTNLKANKKLANPKYYDYYFKVQYWSMALFSYGKGVSYDNRWTLNNQTLMNYPVLIPPLSEQIEIADYLDKKCELIDEIINDIEKEIEILKEYKKSLIFEYVTGKKVVSNEQDSI